MPKPKRKKYPKNLPSNSVCVCHNAWARPHLIEQESEPDIVKFNCCVTGMPCKVKETI
jgi:hypothetical protein